MNLLIDKPECAGDDTVYCLPANINRRNELINGSFCVSREKITVYINGETASQFNIKDFKEFECVRQSGSSMAQGIRKNGERVYLCSFTQEQFLRYAELLKMLEFYVRTDRFPEKSDAPEPFCPICGHPLNGAKKCVFCTKKKDILKRLTEFIQPVKKEFAAAIVCSMLINIIIVGIPYIDRYVIDSYVTPGYAPEGTFTVIIAVTTVLLIVKSVLQHFAMKCSFDASLGMGKQMRRIIFEKAQELSMSSSSKHTAGEMISRISNDTARIEDFFTSSGRDLLVNIALLIVIAVVMFFMNWRLTLAAVIPIPFLIYIQRKNHLKIHPPYAKAWKYSVTQSKVIHDSINGVKMVKSSGQEKQEIEKYGEATQQWRYASERAEKTWYRCNLILQLLFPIGSYLATYLGGQRVLNGAMTTGELIQFTTYAAMLYSPIQWLINISRGFTDVMVSAGKVFEILDEDSEVFDGSAAKELDIKGNISFRSVYFGYKVYNPVLKDINFDIKQGEMIGIVGHSGSGKSTLINLIMRLYDCTGGNVYIDGVDIKDITLESLHSQVGVVLQENFLFDGSILDNIAYARQDAPFEDIINAAKAANAHEFIIKLPDGYNTRVGSKGYQLSGGERQRISIARAILHDPKVIILDEATSALDTVTEKKIQEALGRLTEGRTTIAIAHRLSTLSKADRLLVLDKGRLAEFGTHNELMKKKGVYYKLVMAQRQTAKIKAG